MKRSMERSAEKPGTLYTKAYKLCPPRSKQNNMLSRRLMPMAATKRRALAGMRLANRTTGASTTAIHGNAPTKRKWLHQIGEAALPTSFKDRQESAAGWVKK